MQLDEKKRAFSFYTGKGLLIACPILGEAYASRLLKKILEARRDSWLRAWRKAFSFTHSLLLALCKLVRCSEAIERNEAYEFFSAAG